MGYYSDIETHRSMVFDDVRNPAYERAIRDAVKPGSTVLDLGAGLGQHGLLAAHAGAGRVVLMDPSPVVSIAAEVARANGFKGRVEVVQQRAEDTDIALLADVIVSVFTGNFLLNEDLLPSLFSARDRFLKPGGKLIPGRARMKAALVSAEDWYRDRIDCWSQCTQGLDFSPVRGHAVNKVHFADSRQLQQRMLCEPVTLMELDLATANGAGLGFSSELTVQNAGRCHAILGWFEIELGSEWLSTGPEAEPTHWSLALMPLGSPLDLQAGASAAVSINRPEFGHWTWEVSYGDQRYRHSTFQSGPPDLTFLKSQSAAFVPRPGTDGELAARVLTLMDGANTVEQIIDTVSAEFPSRVKRDPRFKARLRSMIGRWAR